MTEGLTNQPKEKQKGSGSLPQDFAAQPAQNTVRCIDWSFKTNLIVPHVKAVIRFSAWTAALNLRIQEVGEAAFYSQLRLYEVCCRAAVRGR